MGIAMSGGKSPDRRSKRQRDSKPEERDDTLTDNRLIEVLDHVAKRMMDDKPSASDLPKAALEALCELHPKFKKKAELRRLTMEQQSLSKQITERRRSLMGSKERPGSKAASEA